MSFMTLFHFLHFVYRVNNFYSLVNELHFKAKPIHPRYMGCKHDTDTYTMINYLLEMHADSTAADIWMVVTGVDQDTYFL